MIRITALEFDLSRFPPGPPDWSNDGRYMAAVARSEVAREYYSRVYSALLGAAMVDLAVAEADLKVAHAECCRLEERGLPEPQDAEREAGIVARLCSLGLESVKAEAYWLRSYIGRERERLRKAITRRKELTALESEGKIPRACRDDHIARAREHASWAHSSRLLQEEEVLRAGAPAYLVEEWRKCLHFENECAERLIGAWNLERDLQVKIRDLKSRIRELERGL